MEFGISIEGLEELQRLLDEFPDQLDKRDVLKNALREGAEIIKDDAVALCPVYAGPPSKDITPGEGRDSIKVKLSAARGVVKAMVQTGAGDFKGDQFYMSFLEFGHHLGKRTSWSKRSLQKQVSDDYLRQWVQPRPYLRPAFDRNKDRVEYTIREAVARAVEEIAASAGLNRASGSSGDFVGVEAIA